MLHINSCIHIVSEDDFNIQLGWLTFLYDSEVILSTTTGPPSITFFSTYIMLLVILKT